MFNFNRLLAFSVCLVVLPSVGYADSLCSATPAQVSQFVSANMSPWGGIIRFQDWLSDERREERRKVALNSTPQFFPSVIDAISAQKGKEGERLVLDEAFRVYTLSPEKIRGYKKGKAEISSLIEPTSKWLLTVSVKGKPLSVIEVNCTGDKLEVVSSGSKLHAESLASLKNSAKVSSSGEQKFIRTYLPRSELLVVSQNNEDTVYPTNQTATNKNTSGHVPDDIMAVLQSKLAQESER